MNIIEATKAAQEKGAYMKRREWTGNVKIRPTELGYDMEIYRPSGVKRCPMWSPKTEDVLADDWILSFERG